MGGDDSDRGMFGFIIVVQEITVPGVWLCAKRRAWLEMRMRARWKNVSSVLTMANIIVVGLGLMIKALATMKRLLLWIMVDGCRVETGEST